MKRCATGGQNGPAKQGKDGHHFEQGKGAPLGHGGDLRILRLVLLRIGQRQHGAIHHFDGPALQEPGGRGGLLASLRRLFQSRGKESLRQALAGQTISAIFGRDGRGSLQSQQGLKLPDNLTVGDTPMEALPEEAPESALLGISTIAAVWTREGLGKKGGGQGGG